MQQFVGAGLLVGIAGIAVLMARSVRERTRDVGVLRSLGFQPRSVTKSFLLEASFIAVEGVAIGVVVALIGSYGLVLNGTGFMAGFEFAVPWRDIGAIVAIALVATTITALVPSRRAATIKPAVALRTVD
jgi:putative ABC transport system permease protein